MVRSKWKRESTPPPTQVSASHEDQEALTPFHFIMGNSFDRSIPANLNDSDQHCSKVTWRHAVHMANIFWKRWLKEYLPTLSPRRVRGGITTANISDVVIIARCLVSRSRNYEYPRFTQYETELYTWLTSRPAAVYSGGY